MGLLSQIKGHGQDPKAEHLDNSTYHTLLNPVPIPGFKSEQFKDSDLVVDTKYFGGSGGRIRLFILMNTESACLHIPSLGGFAV